MMDEKFVHEYITIEPLNKKFLKVDLTKEASSTWENFLDESLEYSKEHKCWVLINTEFKDFVELVKNVENKESSDESESSDDEMIQKTLSRRLKSASKQLEIDENHVSDSELEDVLSVTRRIRGVYKRVRALEKRIEKIEGLKE